MRLNEALLGALLMLKLIINLSMHRYILGNYAILVVKHFADVDLTDYAAKEMLY